AIASLIVGSALRLVLYQYMPLDYAGLDTMIPPVVSFALFIGVALATQNKYPGKARHGVLDYVPPEEDMITGNDLKNFEGGGQAMPGGTTESTSTSPGDDSSSRNTT
ncbi:MAG: hypothetical protein O6746_05515, partial [Thaumarchaeota archaeon]|nr:hypothetical protein [Nitrososphaerota archaeon]